VAHFTTSQETFRCQRQYPIVITKAKRFNASASTETLFFFENGERHVAIGKKKGSNSIASKKKVAVENVSAEYISTHWQRQRQRVGQRRFRRW
jgi:hypothetical protein